MEDSSETPTTAILPSELLRIRRKLQGQSRHVFAELPRDLIVALGDLAYHEELWRDSYKPRVRVWIPPYSQESFVPKRIVRYEQPIGYCSCPDGLRWFGSTRGRWTPRPVPPKYNIDRFCPWCSEPDGIYYQKCTWSEFAWRHFMQSGLTILCAPPYAPWIGFHKVREEISDVLRHLDSSSVPPLLASRVRRILNHERIPPMDARMILKAIRAECAYLNLEIVEAKLAGAEPNPRYEAQTQGWRAVIAATECAAYMPEMLKDDGCWRLPVTPNWLTNRLTGHFMGLQGSREAWRPWLARLGVEMDWILEQ